FSIRLVERNDAFDIAARNRQFFPRVKGVLERALKTHRASNLPKAVAVSRKEPTNSKRRLRHLPFLLCYGGNKVALVAEDRQAEAWTRRPWRRAATALAVCVALLAIFHRPILLTIGRQIVLRYAARENLKAD